jgi:hypothetical protein
MLTWAKGRASIRGTEERPPREERTSNKFESSPSIPSGSPERSQENINFLENSRGGPKRYPSRLPLGFVAWDAGTDTCIIVTAYEPQPEQ